MIEITLSGNTLDAVAEQLREALERIDADKPAVHTPEIAHVGDVILDYAGREAVVEGIADHGIMATQTEGGNRSFSPHGTYAIIHRRETGVYYTPTDKVDESRVPFADSPLSSYVTCDLVEELQKRGGVKYFTVGDDDSAVLRFTNWQHGTMDVLIEYPSTILMIKGRED